MFAIRGKSQLISITMCAAIAVILVLCLVPSSESKSLKEVFKGKGKYIPEDCNMCEPECETGSVCKEKVIYGDILVCHCVLHKYADIPVTINILANQF